MSEAAMKSVYSVYSMSTVRCTNEIEAENGEIQSVCGNGNLLGDRPPCPGGAAGRVFENRSERLQHPMTREMDGRSGKQLNVSWEQALDYVFDKLKTTISNYGPGKVVQGNSGGPFIDLQKALIIALGSPNYFNHHGVCSNSDHNAHDAGAGHRRSTEAATVRTAITQSSMAVTPSKP